MAEEPKIAQKGPYVKDEQAGRKMWCACGQTQNQPYCDGSHARLNTGIRPVPADLAAPRRVAWCGCRHSANKPFCDGSHNRLP